MAIQFSTDVRNNQLDSVETTIGTGPTLEMRSGAQPADCAAASTGTLLVSMTLPSDWLNAASGGTKTLAGTWQDLSADAAGTIGHFRINQGATCHMQGAVTATGGGGEIEVNNTSVASGQEVNITAFTLTAGGA